ncbi:VanW family protein [Paenibacillus caui]|uniref:VanW family protein n=1 Tax=Paenibacillus caui TaxID=2873927 RepID=UPI001CA95C1A|nr:VanW family protein [Paenibacillus caui]
MKKKRFTVFLLATALFLTICVIFGIRLYAGQNTVPRGVTVGGLSVGSLRISEAAELLSREKAALLRQQVILRGKKFSVETTWSRAGVQAHYNDFLLSLEKLKEGSLWTRAKYRYQFPKKWELETGWNAGPLQKALNSDWENKQFGAMKNAERVIGPDDRIRYIPEVTAPRINWDALSASFRAQMPRSFGSGPANRAVTIEMPLLTASPSVTVQSLKAQGIDRRISILTTGLSGSSGRIHNVEAAARVIDGMLLAPGEVFDYGKVVKEAESRYGFREAPVIVQGTMVPGVGGGICQVSGTLYGAVIRAGLEIVERRNHSRPVSYLPKGQDATFSTGYINFRFKNNTQFYLLISARAEGGRMMVKLFGSMPENVHYEIRSRTVEIIQPRARYVTNPALPAGTHHMLRSGTRGYIVETYRTKWISGKASKEELLSRDTYPAQPSLIAVHSASASPGSETVPPEPKIIEDGIGEGGKLTFPHAPSF